MDIEFIKASLNDIDEVENLREFSMLKTEYSTDGYQRLWGHEFPLQALNRLSISAKSIKQ